MMLVALSSLCLTACSEESSILEETNPSIESEGSSDIASIVKNNTSCTSSYSDYHINITINHSILSELPSASISYVVGHSERGATICQVISGGKYTITPTETSLGDVRNVKIQFPFYYYFMAKQAEASSYLDEEYYSNATTDCEMYLATYLALKSQTSMSANEQSLYNEVKKSLDKYQNEVRGSYTVWIYININGKNFLFKSINI